MKLYLSSYRIPDPKKFVDFVGKPASEIKFGLILNANDYKTSEERSAKRDELFKYYGEIGFSVEEIDLRDYFDKGDLYSKFKEFDVLWFKGGNIYLLRWVIAQSNAMQALKKVLKEGVVYGGESAGAIVAGPTLKYFEKADDPSVASEVFYDGLGLVDFSVLPHWDSEDFGEAVRTAKIKLEEDGFKTIKLDDNEFLLVENGKVVK
jgi:dipeptidase E